VAGGGGVEALHVVGEHEVLRVRPDGTAGMERHRLHDLAVARDAGHLALEHRDDLSRRRRHAFHDSEPADGHVVDAVSFGVDEEGIQGAHPVGHCSPR